MTKQNWSIYIYTHLFDLYTTYMFNGQSFAGRILGKYMMYNLIWFNRSKNIFPFNDKYFRSTLRKIFIYVYHDTYSSVIICLSRVSIHSYFFFLHPYVIDFFSLSFFLLIVGLSLHDHCYWRTKYSFTIFIYSQIIITYIL